MMGKKTLVDITGITYGRYTVIGLHEIRNKHTYWDCVCECGNKGVVDGGNLKNGNSYSCGCWKKEVSRKMLLTHGDKDSAEYTAWSSMINRVTNPKCERYIRYGGRGITVCDRWLHSYENFLEDMGRRPSPIHSLDRIENDKDYCKSNCRWATRIEQANNKSNNVIIDVDGLSMSIAMWAKKINVGYNYLYSRYRRGCNMPSIINSKIMIDEQRLQTN